MSGRTRILALTAGLLALFWFAVHAADSPAREDGVAAPPGRAYTIGIIPFYTPEKIWNLYSPLIQHLNKNTSVRWDLKLYPDHDTLIADLCGSSLSLALVGPVPLGRASGRCGARPILVTLAKDGKPAYHAVVVTNDPSITALSEVKGRAVGFFRGSTVSHIMAVKMLKDEGITLRMIRPVFYEGQDSLVTALLKKEIAAAAIKDVLYEKFRETGLRALKVSEPLPKFSFAAAPGLDPGARKQFLAALTKLRPLTSPADRSTVEAWDEEIKYGFILPTDAFLREVLRLGSLTEEILHETR